MRAVYDFSGVTRGDSAFQGMGGINSNLPMLLLVLMAMKKIMTTKASTETVKPILVTGRVVMMMHMEMTEQRQVGVMTMLVTTIAAMCTVTVARKTKTVMTVTMMRRGQ